MESSEPSYFQRREEAHSAPPPTIVPAPTPSSPALDAEVLWFNAEKGFGFARLSNGSDAFLHMSKLQTAGYSNLLDGARLKVRIEVGHKGPQVSEVVSVGEGPGPVPPSPMPIERAPETTPGEGEGRGLVKWYDAVKGFGFIALENGGNDVFVHATTVTRDGLTTLEVGQSVTVSYGQGKKGLEARSLRLV